VNLVDYIDKNGQSIDGSLSCDDVRIRSQNTFFPIVKFLIANSCPPLSSLTMPSIRATSYLSLWFTK